MERSSEALPIKDSDLAAHSDRANALLKKVSYTPKATDSVARPKPGDIAFMTAARLSVESKDVSIYAIAHTVNSESMLLLPDRVNHALLAVWQGLRLGAHLGKLYEKASNLEVLVNQNRQGVLPPDHRSEFRDKQTTAAAITQFVTAFYIAWELSRESGDDSKAEIDGVPELNLQNPVDGVSCMLYYLSAYLSRPELVVSEADFVKVIKVYFRAVAQEIQSRVDALKYAEPFTSRAYKLEKGEFAVNAFTLNLGGSTANVEFNRVEIDNIVGNRAAKRQAKLIAQRLVCYDPATKRNPMLDLGGLPKIRMGSGPPGTGKSMLIAAIATMVSDYCKALNYPFSFRPLPDNIISTFQGGSAEKAVEWFTGFQDPSRIQYGTIDDGEVVMEERSRQNVSAGVRELIGVFLRRTEGAYAVNHGNYTIDIYTNLPDQIDKAVLSRIVYRFMIAGAETAADFVDQDYLWWRKVAKIDPRFVDMVDDPTYEYMFNQRMLQSLSEAAVRHEEPQDERLRGIFRRVRERRDPTEHAFFGELFAAVRAEFPFFTSRDVRNIQSAVDGRIMDFDLPDEWLEQPEMFYFKGYDEKKAMLVELMRGNMKGLTFSTVRLQETIMYLDEMIRIAEVTRARTIQDGVDRMVMELEVNHRFDQLRTEGKLVHVGVNS